MTTQAVVAASSPASAERRAVVRDFLTASVPRCDSIRPCGPCCSSSACCALFVSRMGSRWTQSDARTPPARCASCRAGMRWTSFVVSKARGWRHSDSFGRKTSHRSSRRTTRPEPTLDGRLECVLSPRRSRTPAPCFSRWARFAASEIARCRRLLLRLPSPALCSLWRAFRCSSPRTRTSAPPSGGTTVSLSVNRAVPRRRTSCRRSTRETPNRST